MVLRAFWMVAVTFCMTLCTHATVENVCTRYDPGQRNGKSERRDNKHDHSGGNNMQNHMLPMSQPRIRYQCV